MKEKTKILQRVKVLTILSLLLFMVSSKGYFQEDVTVVNLNETSESSEKDTENDEIASISYEATISFFSVEFDDLSSFSLQRVNLNPFKNTFVRKLFVVSTTEYFRILFSKILPINAP